MASHLMLQRCFATAPLTSETSPPRRRRLRRMAVDQPPQGSVGGLNCGPRSRTCAVCASHVCRTERCCRCHWLAEAATRRCAPSHILLAAFSTRLAPRCTADLHSPCHALCVGRGHHWTQCKCVACEDLAQIRHALLQRAPRLPCHQPSSHVQLRHMVPAAPLPPVAELQALPRLRPELAWGLPIRFDGHQLRCCPPVLHG